MDRSSLISAAEDVLRQGLGLLDNIEEAAYSRKEEGPWGSSIGAQYRHVLDHFLCLIEGLCDYQINYDNRDRNREIETSVNIARSVTEDILKTLHGIPAQALHHDCLVTYSVGYGDHRAQSITSIVARELMFCVGHAIHHYAILKLLCSMRAVTLPCEFGIAPSTLKYERAQTAS